MTSLKNVTLIPFPAPIAEDRNTRSKKIETLLISQHGGVKILPLDQIIYLQAKGSYTELILTVGGRMVVSKPLCRFEEKLHSLGFYRIHKTYMINLRHLREYETKDGEVAVLTNGIRLYLSRNRTADFLRMVEEVTRGISL